MTDSTSVSFGVEQFLRLSSNQTLWLSFEIAITGLVVTVTDKSTLLTPSLQLSFVNFMVDKRWATEDSYIRQVDRLPVEKFVG